MNALATVQFENSEPVTSDFEIIDHGGKKLLVWKRLDDGTQFCLHLDDLSIVPRKSLWGQDMFYVGLVPATPERAIVVPPAI